VEASLESTGSIARSRICSQVTSNPAPPRPEGLGEDPNGAPRLKYPARQNWRAESGHLGVKTGGSGNISPRELPALVAVCVHRLAGPLQRLGANGSFRAKG
jgi:hypothetical protein